MTVAFEQLSWRAQLARLRRAAECSLRAYGLAESRMRLLKYEDNAIYKVLSPSGQQFVLRLAFEQSCTSEELDSELRWLLALADETEFDSPTPQQTNDGRLVTSISVAGVSALGCLLTWIPGRPLTGSRLTTTALYQTGRAMAWLHEHSQNWTPPSGFKRPGWDVDWLNSELPALLKKHQSGLGRDGFEVLGSALHRVAAELAKLGKSGGVFGLVHADLNLENVLLNDRRVGLIDFDDCGWGYYIYDLATTISRLHRETRDESRRQRLQQAFVSGYETVGPLPDGFQEFLPWFLAFRDW
jgi:Ser/Thr protein kinase RdoA (MazF antagonist)